MTVTEVIAKHCLCYRVRKLSRVMTNLYDAPLRRLGLKLSQMTLLVVTERWGPVRPVDVCQILQMEESTLSRNVNRMRSKGWLEFVPENDARAHPFQLTAKGRKLLGQAFPVWKEAQQHAAALLGSDGVAFLHRVNRTIGGDTKPKEG